jgi:glucose dehydrogenase
MSWTKNETTPAIYHRAETKHFFRKGGVELETDVDNNVARVSMGREGQRYTNAIKLDRSQIDNVIELLRAWRDAV